MIRRRTLLAAVGRHARRARRPARADRAEADILLSDRRRRPDRRRSSTATARRFQQETGIAVEPVYAGDYSQTLIKALDRDQGRQPGRSSPCCWRPRCTACRTRTSWCRWTRSAWMPTRKKWLDGFYPAFMANSHADGKTWSVPFQRSTAIFYYNKAAFQDAGLDPEKFPTTWAELADDGGEADQARRVRAGDALGHQDGRRSRQRAMDVRRARQSGRADADERGGHRGLFQPAEDDRGDGVLARPGRRRTTRRRTACRTGRSCRPTSWRATRRSSSTRPAIWRMCADKAQFPFGVAGLAGKNAPHTVVGGGNMYFFRNASPAERAGGAAVCPLGQRAGARRGLVDPHRLHRHPPGGVRDAGAEGLHREGSRGQRGAQRSCRWRPANCRCTRTSASTRR